MEQQLAGVKTRCYSGAVATEFVSTLNCEIKQTGEALDSKFKLESQQLFAVATSGTSLTIALLTPMRKRALAHPAETQATISRNLLLAVGFCPVLRLEVLHYHFDRSWQLRQRTRLAHLKINWPRHGDRRHCPALHYCSTHTAD